MLQVVPNSQGAIPPSLMGLLKLFSREKNILKLRDVDNVWCVSFIWGKLNQELIRRDPIWSADQIQTNLASATWIPSIFTLSAENIAYLRIDITCLNVCRPYLYILINITLWKVNVTGGAVPIGGILFLSVSASFFLLLAPSPICI